HGLRHPPQRLRRPAGERGRSHDARQGVGPFSGHFPERRFRAPELDKSVDSSHLVLSPVLAPDGDMGNGGTERMGGAPASVLQALKRMSGRYLRSERQYFPNS